MSTNTDTQSNDIQRANTNLANAAVKLKRLQPATPPTASHTKFRDRDRRTRSKTRRRRTKSHRTAATESEFLARGAEAFPTPRTLRHAEGGGEFYRTVLNMDDWSCNEGLRIMIMGGGDGIWEEFMYRGRMSREPGM